MFTHGSSPHTWGIRPPGGRSASGSRFIPTYVGHTSGGATTPTRLRFIPTYVGHTYALQNAPTMPGGSSPHTWGIQQAGFSGSRRPPVHPHIRGAYSKLGFQALGVRRFIPTYVGHTSDSVLFPEKVTVHPHIRGAYLISACLSRLAAGSSPHTWGIRVSNTSASVRLSVHPHIRGAYGPHCVGVYVQARFIPTYVGHTVVGRVNPSVMSGSSPHTWGIR